MRFQQEIEQLKRQLEDTVVASGRSHNGSHEGGEGSPDAHQRVVAWEVENQDLRMKLEEAVAKELLTLDSATPQQRSWQAAEKVQQQLRARVSELECELEGAVEELRALRSGGGVRGGTATEAGAGGLRGSLYC